MPKQKHSILLVLAILGGVIIFLGMVMLVALQIAGPSSGLTFEEKIGVIPIYGTIMNAEPVIFQLIKFKKDKRIKAIVLRVDSPGGGVGAAQEIYREIRKTMAAKRVVVSMGGVAASGGYYVAAAADKIVANPGTITGSIGVIMEFIQMEELLKKIGITLEVIKSGEFKDIGSPHRKISERERELMNHLIADIQDQFVSAVADGRGLSKEAVREIADGRIISGAMAKELGLVDQLGNFQDAVELAKKLCGIKGEVGLIYPEKAKIGIWDLISQKATTALYKVVLDLTMPHLEYRWKGQ
ncbi:MAG: signal peptide peptidase SppA [Deltaproteobacteria bacterium]|nr:signal peptide peptidase SppA [Deltaproteobacteria bacterium]